jgi:hypothetical protein
MYQKKLITIKTINANDKEIRYVKNKEEYTFHDF